MGRMTVQKFAYADTYPEMAAYRVKAGMTDFSAQPLSVERLQIEMNHKKYSHFCSICNEA